MCSPSELDGRVQATGIACHGQSLPEAAGVKIPQYQSPALIAQAQVLRFVRDGAHAARGSQGTTSQALQRVWLPPVAGPGCNVIAGTGYIKSANDESLARDEGGGRKARNLFMEVVTYKTVQGRQLRMTPATATFFSRLWMQLRAGWDFTLTAGTDGQSSGPLTWIASNTHISRVLDLHLDVMGHGPLSLRAHGPPVPASGSDATLHLGPAASRSESVGGGSLAGLSPDCGPHLLSPAAGQLATGRATGMNEPGPTGGDPGMILRSAQLELELPLALEW
jgi:hypothetical protein